ncbi:RNA-binding domain-containing protein [Butyrivibrio sp. INlla21]|uniref:RNA-binding domain-containing protein n=1 Tax=Butyrivibrio sp. INlla21 TaxID=1520811 RepID=UPI0008EBAFD9|nr:RNA-binding domain-containing protein [Butyrivibrio sp. INlla21]SFU65954.1 Putative ATP-dependent DNA helicase recG C-terminal [Butyrivibrio sp. INlla21]
MNIEELLPGLGLEDKYIEYKGIIEEGKSANGKVLEVGWLKTLVAFANTEGGRLIIGVEDKTHKVVALDKKTADRVILLIHRKVREKIDPVIDYEIDNIPIGDKDKFRYVLIVQVKRSKSLPVTLHEEGLLGIYVRNYGRTDLATSEQIKDLVLMSDNAPFDAAETEETFDTDDYTNLFNVAKERKSRISEKELKSKRAVSAEGKATRGLLLFKNDCDDQRTKVVATVWPGITKGGTIVSSTEEYVGDILTVIQKSIEFIKNHSNNGFKKEATKTVEYRAYPERAVTEGVVNAVGHRNYYMQGTQIEINIFIDRMEITSPGSLLGVRELIKEKDIASIIPRRRNEIICDILEMCKYMEKKGSGFDNIEADYAGRGDEYAPYITADSTYFTLTLPDLTYSKGVLTQEEDYPEVYVEQLLEGKNDLKVLSFCFNTPRTAREIADAIGVTPSTYFRSNVLGRLSEQGFLIEKAASGANRYVSNPDKVKIKV